MLFRVWKNMTSELNKMTKTYELRKADGVTPTCLRKSVLK